MKLLIAIFVLITPFNSLYSSNSKVVQLTPENWKRLVIDSDDIWLVEFYAPWCGHCKSLAPEFDKAAKALSPMVKLGAVDMTQHQQLGSPYNIQGFPTLKFFGLNKNKPTDYNQQRTANAIVDYCMSQAKSVVQQRLSGKSNSQQKPKKPQQKKTPGKAREGSGRLEELSETEFRSNVLRSDDQWFVLFYAPWCGHCKAMMPDFEQAAQNVPKLIRFAKVDCTANQSLCGEYQVQGYPTLKYFNGGKAEDYNGGRSRSDLEEFANRKSELHTPPKDLAEMTTQSIFEDYCVNHDGICFIAFLPHIKDSGEEQRKKYVEELKELWESSRGEPFNFLWVQGGNNYDLEQTFQLGFGFPSFVSFHFGKKKYSIMRAKYSKQSINKFIDDLRVGKSTVYNIPNVVPKVKERKTKKKMTTEEL